MSIVAAVIGSLTALFIAAVVYPWQKAVDRSSDYAKEKRSALLEAIKILPHGEKLYQLTPEDEFRIESAITLLFVVSEFEASNGLQEVLDAMRAYRAAMKEGDDEAIADSKARINGWFNGYVTMTNVKVRDLRPLHPTLWSGLKQGFRKRTRL